MRRITSLLAALVAVGTAAAGLALTPAEADLSYTQPNIPVEEIQLLDLPNYPAWLTLDGNEVTHGNETEIGVQYNQFGPAPGARLETERAVASNELPNGFTFDADDLVAMGDLDGDGSPEQVGYNGFGLSRTGDLSDGLPVRSSRRIDTEVNAAVNGPAVALGVVDNGTVDKYVWVATERGFLLLYRFTGTNFDLVDTHSLALPANQSILDGASPSILEQDVYDPGGRAHSAGGLRVLRAVDNGSTSTVAVDIVALNTITDTFGSVTAGGGQAVPWPAGAGSIRVDSIESAANDDETSTHQAWFVTRADDARDGYLQDPAYSGPFCRSEDPNRGPEFDFEAIANGGNPYGYSTCAADVGVAGGKRQLRVEQTSKGLGGNEGLVSSWTYATNAATSGPIDIQRTSIDLPCAWLMVLPQPGASCLHQGRTETLVHHQDAAGANRLEVVSRNALLGRNLDSHDGDEPVDLTTAASTWSYGTTLSTGGDPQVIPLPPGRNRVKIRLDDHTAPDTVVGRPRPIVVLASPPYVAGAGQSPLAGPTYNKRQSTGGSTGSSTSNSFSVMYGMDIEDPTGLFGASASVTLESEVSSELTESLEITGAEQYVGSPVEDTIIYDAPTVWRYTGTIIESANGIGLGTETTLDVPRSNVISSATFTQLQTRYPEVFGRPPGWVDAEHPGVTPAPGKGALDRILTHDVGNPGTYTDWDAGPAASPNVSSYCDNASFDDTGTAVDERGTYPYGVADNPFVEPRLDQRDLEGPGILFSENHHVETGTNNSEGAGFSITNATEESRASTMSVDAEAAFKGAGLTAGFGGGHTWGESWSSSFSSGVDFLAYVGHLPTDLDKEDYDWRIFLCKKRLGAAGTEGDGAPVWVLNYTVDNYHGSGGLEELGDITLGGPTQSTLAHTFPEFSWSQETGTVKSYDLEIEAVDAPAQDHRTFENLLEITDSVLASQRDLDVTRTWRDLGSPEELAPNSLYRWRVTSRDLFDNETTSDWAFFRTDGPTDNLEVEASDPTPTAGAPVTISWTHDEQLLATVYEIDLGDGRTLPRQAARSTTVTYPLAGVYPVTVRAINFYNGADDPPVTASTIVSVGPNAVGESYATAPLRPVEDTTFTVGDDDGVMDNDTGADLVRVTAEPAHGDLDLELDGAFTYEPDPNYCGADEFTYAVRGGASVRYATATLDVQCVNDAPTIGTIPSTSVLEDGVLEVQAPGVLATADDVDGDELTAEKVTNPSHGTVTVSPNGAFTYTPTPDYCGTDAFTVRAKDDGVPSLASAARTVPITVTCVNDAPTAGTLSYSATEDEPLVVTSAAGLRTGAADVDDPTSALQATVVAPAANGTVVANSSGNGAFSYTPNPDFCGTDSFTYQVADPGGLTSAPPSTVTLTVACVNDAPQATGRSYPDGTEDTLLTAAADRGLLSAATDVDDPREELRATVLTGPANGTLTGPRDDGSFDYQPRANWCGNDSFTFEVRDDGGAETGPLTADIAVACVNDAPTAVPDTFSGLVDGQPFTAPAPGVLANDSDIEGDPLTVEARTGFTTAGPVTFNADGSLSITPTAGFYGVATQTYSVLDGKGGRTTTGVAFMVKARTTLTATKAVISGSQGTVKATLRGLDGRPAVGATVVFTLNNQPGTFCTATTGPDGVATCSGAVPNLLWRLGGKYTARFDGNATHLASTSASTAFGG